MLHMLYITCTRLHSLKISLKHGQSNIMKFYNSYRRRPAFVPLSSWTGAFIDITSSMFCAICINNINLMFMDVYVCMYVWCVCINIRRHVWLPVCYDCGTNDIIKSLKQFFFILNILSFYYLIIVTALCFICLFFS